MIKEKVNRTDWRPQRVVGKNLEKTLVSFIQKHPGIIVVNQISGQLRELFLLRHPQYRFDQNYQRHLKTFLITNYPHPLSVGQWFYFPWDNRLIHYLNENDHQELRTGRNRFLITAAEQATYYGARVGILGMSVGSHVALTIAMTGGAKYLKLADLDIISGSNLNRIRTGFSALGLSKVKAVARQIYEINPYSQITIFPKGLTDQNIDKFFTADDGLSLIIEEMDNPYLKLRAREVARKYKVPMIMAADNGDGVIVDVERYDQEPLRPLLHGILGETKAQDLKSVHPKDLPAIIAKMAGAQFAAPRMLQSVGEVGKSIYSWPQLGTAATMCGSTLANLGRRIILGEDIKSGRFIVNELEMFKPAKL